MGRAGRRPPGLRPGRAPLRGAPRCCAAGACGRLPAPCTGCKRDAGPPLAPATAHPHPAGICRGWARRPPRPPQGGLGWGAAGGRPLRPPAAAGPAGPSPREVQGNLQTRRFSCKSSAVIQFSGIFPAGRPKTPVKTQEENFRLAFFAPKDLIFRPHFAMIKGNTLSKRGTGHDTGPASADQR